MTVKGNIKKERKKVGPLSSYCEFLWSWESLGNETKILFKLLYTDRLNTPLVFFLWMWNDFTGYGTVIREPKFCDHSFVQQDQFSSSNDRDTGYNTLCHKILMLAQSLTLPVREPLPCTDFNLYFSIAEAIGNTSWWEQGPAGLQLGHYLQESGRDYVIIEKASMPG